MRHMISLLNMSKFSDASTTHVALHDNIKVEKQACKDDAQTSALPLSVFSLKYKIYKRKTEYLNNSLETIPHSICRAT